MTSLGLVLDVGRVNGDTASLLFRGLVNLVVVGELGTASLGKDLGNGGGQCSLSMIDVSCSEFREGVHGNAPH